MQIMRSLRNLCHVMHSTIVVGLLQPQVPSAGSDCPCPTLAACPPTRLPPMLPHPSPASQLEFPLVPLLFCSPRPSTCLMKQSCCPTARCDQDP